ncbi:MULTISPECIES: dihydrofolate reductase family protein [Streptomyces]|uniref:Dihydrofolate reductase family protein n=1 Tax=Streptomyces katrae TaxID=68223 RepID=A0ABT7H257_9ACTN|nr:MULTISPECIES: dihydrofolate reductase family protein [Streptomyces]MDK9499544.1 dihydrofolate reductase family protein [Streptomyces katrae]GLX20314.1 deaminase [Streptomyces lavendulae subsp. lavendulae]GLX30914.1 deaminase [Streptomyces lavendulae subsp. lavendulae]
MRKLTYFIATTVDGFIGAPDGDADFIYSYVDSEFIGLLTAEYPETISAAGRKQLGIEDAPPKRFDAVIMGRNTYEPGLKAGLPSPYGHMREQYVVSRSLTTPPDPQVRLISGDLVAAVREMKARDGLGIWLCGGADLAAQLADEIDEYVVKTYPVVVGTGMPMSRAGFGVRPLELTGCTALGGGQVVTSYDVKR